MSIATVIALIILALAILASWTWISLRYGIDNAKSSGWLLFWLCPLAILTALAFVAFVALAWLLMAMIII